MRTTTRSKVRKGWVAFAGGVLALGALTACGDDDPDAASPFGVGGQVAAGQGDSGEGAADAGGKGGGKGGGKVPAELVGVWKTGSASPTTYQDAVTGAFAPASGTHRELTIKADGSYSQNGLLQSTVYSCTTSLFVAEEGKATVQGDKITFKPDKLKTTMQNTCSESGNYANRDGEKRTVVETFELTEDEYGPLLRLTDPEGASSDYRPQE
ncbi:hypothetical protein LO772_27750 [Yinghuangia sp. ASG 101]|uniref:hypothetical protein n=1 Tax=Yinghuangia sp. ASG 101 TaxID=2896848 RepID=UPI001E626977|nr:hypothetical protein [Yinghuangia sp. ASG 101]UGQ10601.1 hypothetical protein LO772_27750 [Yinghuangia sp. ASG 101]